MGESRTRRRLEKAPVGGHVILPTLLRLHTASHGPSAISIYPGRMTWEEMMSPFFGVLVDSKTDPKTVLKLKGQTVNGTGA
jgi:hypothetical protein